MPHLNPRQAGSPVLNYHTPDGWKTEITPMIGYIPRWFTCQQTHPRSNQAKHSKNFIDWNEKSTTTLHQDNINVIF